MQVVAFCFERVTLKHSEWHGQRGKEGNMAYAVFAALVTTAGVIASVIPGGNVESKSMSQEYRYIPYAGDVWGA